MIKEISFKKFKKLIDIDFSFNEDINIISGTNGTCKTTLLHLISNGFQMPPSRSQNYSNSNCVRVIKSINKIANPKMEAIVRESKNYTDPAEGTKGVLFSINYLDHSTLDFRKHNSKIQTKRNGMLSNQYTHAEKKNNHFQLNQFYILDYRDYSQLVKLKTTPLQKFR
ncbi:AAA family ATPase [Escherichia coli]|nr:AAA family ATPase [Escherichia coli]